jgi:hypothetical protein
MKATWTTLPAAMKNMAKMPPVYKKLEWKPGNAELARFAKKFAGSDELRPAMTGMGFMETYIGITDAHRLFYKPANNKKPNIYALDGSVIDDVRYPDCPAVIPRIGTASHEYKKSEINISSIDVQKLLTYCKVAVNFANETTGQGLAIYNNERLIGFNARFMIDLLDQAARLGFTKLDLYIFGPTRAMVFCPPGKEPMQAETFLLMPLMLNDSDERIIYTRANATQTTAFTQKTKTHYYASRDLDFGRELNGIYDLDKNEIREGTPESYTTHAITTSTASGQAGLSEDDLKLLRKFTPKNSTIPILDCVAVSNGTARASNLEYTLEIDHSGLSDGVYLFSKDGYLFKTDDTLDDFPLVLPPDEKPIEHIIVNLDRFRHAFSTASEFVDKDIFNDKLGGIRFEITRNNTQIAATDRHILTCFNIDTLGQHTGNYTVRSAPLLAYLTDRFKLATFSFAKRFAVINFNNGIRFTARLIDENFPAYRSVLPPNQNWATTITASQYKSAVVAAKKFRNKEDVLFAGICFTENSITPLQFDHNAHEITSVGQSTATKPSRSDYHPEDDQILIMPMQAYGEYADKNTLSEEMASRAVKHLPATFTLHGSNASRAITITGFKEGQQKQTKHIRGTHGTRPTPAPPKKEQPKVDIFDGSHKPPGLDKYDQPLYEWKSFEQIENYPTNVYSTPWGAVTYGINAETDKHYASIFHHLYYMEFPPAEYMEFDTVSEAAAQATKYQQALIARQKTHQPASDNPDLEGDIEPTDLLALEAEALLLELELLNL